MRPLFVVGAYIYIYKKTRCRAAPEGGGGCGGKKTLTACIHVLYIVSDPRLRSTRPRTKCNLYTFSPVAQLSAAVWRTAERCFRLDRRTPKSRSARKFLLATNFARVEKRPGGPSKSVASICGYGNPLFRWSCDVHGRFLLSRLTVTEIDDRGFWNFKIRLRAYGRPPLSLCLFFFFYFCRKRESRLRFYYDYPAVVTDVTVRFSRKRRRNYEIDRVHFPPFPFGTQNNRGPVVFFFSFYRVAFAVN